MSILSEARRDGHGAHRAHAREAPHPLSKTTGNGHRAGKRAVRQDGEKLFSAPTSGNVALPRTLQNSARYLAKQKVARCMTERIVHSLEVVEIVQRYAKEAGTASCQVHLALQRCQRPPPVAKPRQRVGLGNSFELGGAIGFACHVAVNAQLARAVWQPNRTRGPVNHSSPRTHEHESTIGGVGASGGDASEEVTHLVCVLPELRDAFDQVRSRKLKELPNARPDELGELLIGKNEAPVVAIDEKSARAEVFEDYTEVLRCVSADAFRDVFMVGAFE